MLEQRIYQSFHELESAGIHWEALHSYLDSPTSDYDWIYCSAKHLLEKNSFYIVVTLNSGIPIAIAPLARSSGYSSPVTQIGKGHGEPNDFSYQDDTSLHALTDALAQYHLPLSLARVPADSKIISAIKKSYSGNALVIIRSRQNCPYIKIADNEQQTMELLPSRLKSDLRRASRRATAIGQVTFNIHSPITAEALLPLWQEALHIEAASWKGDSGSALLINERMGRFFKSFVTRAAKKGILRICFLKIDNQPIAMQIALEVNERFWLLKIGYDAKFSKCSPGMLLMEWTLRHATIRGLKSYEFLGTAKDWTRRWTKNERKNVAIRVFPYTLQGLTMLSQYVLKYIWSKIVSLYN